MAEAQISNTIAPEPAVPSVEGAKTLAEIIPAEFKDRPYMKGLAELEYGPAGFGELFKKLDGAQTLLGKKSGVPAPDAPDEEWDKFYGGLRPETVDAYEIDEKVDPDFAKLLRQGYMDAGLSPRQAKKFQAKVLADLEARNAEGAAKSAKLDAEFATLMESTFGAENKAVLDRVTGIIRENAPEALKHRIPQLSNEDLVVLAGVVNAVAQKFGAEDEIDGNGATATGGGSDPAAMRQEAEKLIASPAWGDAFNPDHSRVVARVNELFKAADAREKAAGGFRRKA